MTRRQAEAADLNAEHAAMHEANAALVPNCVFPIGVTVHV